MAPDADAETRQRLTDAAEASHHVELPAYVLSDTDQQRGPAHIVTFSQDPYRTNVTLAQEDRHLIFRIRTALSDPTELYPEFMLPNAVQIGNPTRVAATFERGVITMQAKNGTSMVSGIFRSDFRWSALQLRGRSLSL